MKTLEHAIDINAPTDAVWSVLTDFAAYGDWNPFMTVDADSPDVGTRIEVRIQPPGRGATTLKPAITHLEPGVRLSWLGRLFVPRLFDGAHTFRLEALPGGRTRFVQHEEFRGLLVPFVGKILRDTGAGFVEMNAALKTRAEATVAVAADASIVTIASA